MTTTTQLARPRWVLAVLTALMVVWALVLAAGTASAATGPAAENRIRASVSTAQTLDRPPESVSADQRLENGLPQPGIVVATGVAANTAGKADFIASADGVVVPTSRSRLVAGFEDARLPSSPTSSAGTQYTLPDGSLVRVMEPSGQAGLRASFTNPNGGPINPFTGKPVQPPPGLSKPERLDYIRSRTHIELEP